MCTSSSAPELAAAVCAYYRRNREFLSTWSPCRPDSFYTEEGQRAVLDQCVRERQDDMGCRYYLTRKETPDEVIGMTALNQIIRGGFQSSFVGYSLDRDHLRRGYMTEALSALAELAFGPLGLHRLEANIMPSKTASLRTARRCGFRAEGISPAYMNINGVWEDHIHMVRLAPAVEH